MHLAHPYMLHLYVNLHVSYKIELIACDFLLYLEERNANFNLRALGYAHLMLHTQSRLE